MITDEQKQQLWDLIKQIKVGMVVSHHNEDLRARPMHIAVSYTHLTLPTKP